MHFLKKTFHQTFKNNFIRIKRIKFFKFSLVIILVFPFLIVKQKIFSNLKN